MEDVDPNILDFFTSLSSEATLQPIKENAVIGKHKSQASFTQISPSPARFLLERRFLGPALTKPPSSPNFKTRTPVTFTNASACLLAVARFPIPFSSFAPLNPIFD
jgi:hypothetical protein